MDRADLERRVDELAEQYTGQAFADAIKALAGGGVRTRRDLDRMRDVGCDGALVASALHAGEIGAADVAALGADPQSDANASR